MQPFEISPQNDGQKAGTRNLIGKLRADRKAWIGLLLTGVICLLYGLGVAIALTSLPWSFLALPFLAEAMILSWYLSHECAHLLVFKSRRNNVILGEFLGWFNGGLFFSFDEFRNDHIRHHAEHVDLVSVDVGQFMATLPRTIHAAIFILEAIYVPAAYLSIKAYCVVGAFSAERSVISRVAFVTCSYAAFYGSLFYVSPVAMLIYCGAVSARIHCIRFVDAFQHTYEHVNPEHPRRAHERSYEQLNTFSFPVARKYTFLNYLILNFGFHNAHHAVMTCPWYNLRKLDELLHLAKERGDADPNRNYDRHDVSFFALVQRYHKDRVSRITAGDAGAAYDAEAEMTFSMRRFHGAFTDNLLG